MKRAFISAAFFLLLSYQPLLGQLMPLIETGKVWHACVGFAEWSPSQITLKIDKDTVIGNNSYRQVKEFIWGSILNMSDTVIAGWIREDSFNRVYFLGNNLTGDCIDNDTAETLLYDFSVGVNDTVFYATGWRIIQSVDSIVANGVTRKIWIKGQSSNTCNFGNDTVIEGIGSTKSLLYPRWIEFENTYSLKCVDTNSIQIYPESACVCLIGLGVDNLVSNMVSVTPNPCSTAFYVQVNHQPLQSVRFYLYNSMGSLVRQENITETSTTITSSNLTTGIYLWQLCENNTVLAKGKVVLH